MVLNAVAAVSVEKQMLSRSWEARWLSRAEDELWTRKRQRGYAGGLRMSSLSFSWRMQINLKRQEPASGVHDPRRLSALFVNTPGTSHASNGSKLPLRFAGRW